MTKKTGPTNENLKLLIQQLRKEASTRKVDLWKRIADELEKPTRHRRAVNLSRINRHTQPNEAVIIPGKVLSSGNLTHSVTIAAYAFSQSTHEKIANSKGKTLTIQELLTQNPDGKNIRIIG